MYFTTKIRILLGRALHTYLKIAIMHALRDCGCKAAAFL